jgi:cell division septation protein DedD
LRPVTLDRSSVIAALVGLVLVLLLVFAAGYFTGLHSALAEEATDPAPPALSTTSPRVSAVDRPPSGPLPPSDVTGFDTGDPDEGGDVLGPEPDAVAEAAPPATGGGEFTVQLGAFRDPAHARALASELEQAHGVGAEVASQSDPDLGVLYKLWAGRFATLGEAEEEAQRLRDLTGREAWPVHIVR